ncbi:unnamed protein product [Bursaphelenchus okinawaensis]|uniref:Palmitoyltransferase n=1 Tax=Bursaphelenchus okinawaensis TaxID=465554 RepID=A0A811JVF0_9BILA|nr:unnamed protein product [Bursaphelenchus okinawaensis]CAG9085106.1 unnamed protein product [Bursaphelenchus okinawaensis]
MWIQPVLWYCSFMVWYQIFTTAFLTFVAIENWTYLCIIYLIYVVLFSFTLGCLFQAFYAPFPTLPPEYHLPANWLELAETEHKNEPEYARMYYKARSFARGLTNIRRETIRLNGKTMKFPSFCLKCNIIKPKDTRHCNRCKACLPRMDHHCPALGKCVHFGNHKHFLVFLIYSVLICTYTDVVAGYYTWAAFVYCRENMVSELLVPISAAATGLIQTISFPIILAWFQYGLWESVLQGILTVEACYEDEKAKKVPRSAWLGNVKKIFGEHYWVWPLPIQDLPEENAYLL